MLTDSQLETLAQIAADAVIMALRWGPADPGPAWPTDPALTSRGASFVTLRQGTDIRGCVGSLSAFRALHRDVAENARGAAFRDPRFEPLLLAELAETHADAAVLTAASPLSFDDERDLYRQLCPGADGLVVGHRDALATFLPGMWARHAEPDHFVGQLRLKAGIDQDVSMSELTFHRFGASLSAPVSLDREVSPRQDLRATWWSWRWRWRARERVKRLARRRAIHAGQR